MNQRIENLRIRLEKTRSQLLDIGDFRPGSITKQKRKARGKVYGEYCYLSYTFKGESFTEYVPTKHLARIRGEIRAYGKFKRLMDQYVALSIKISQETTRG